MFQIDTLMPPLYIYSFKTIIEISSYYLFYKTKYKVKLEKVKTKFKLIY